MGDAPSLSQVSFSCKHCNKLIFIPVGLPVTVAPCPHCGKEVTSPDQSQPKQKPESQVSAESVSKVEALSSSKNNGDIPLSGEMGSLPDKGEYLGKQREGNTTAITAAVAVLLAAAGVIIWMAQGSGNKTKPSPPVVYQESERPVKPSAPVLQSVPDPEPEPISRLAWLRENWKEEALEVLKSFTMAKTAEEKLKYTIPNEGVSEEMKMYYSRGNDDSDTPAQSFEYVKVSDEDMSRGIFLMQYHHPAKVNASEYFPRVEPLQKHKETDSLLEMTNSTDEDDFSKPLGINAFFKDIGGELKLDASVFIQGKYRTFRLFTTYPQPGKVKMFRVVVSESLNHHYIDNSEVRTYRFEDFAYAKDFVSLPVEIDSKVGKTLSELNWHGKNRDRIYKTATVEFEWSDEDEPKLCVNKVVCWEFLGIGGEIGNTLPVDEAEAEPGSEE